MGQGSVTSIDRIASAAGLSRRTVYGHFKNRAELLQALGDEVAAEVRDAVDSVRRDDDPTHELARLLLAVWRVGAEYRVVLVLGKRVLGDEQVRTLLTPITERVTSLVASGQKADLFDASLPADVLTRVLQASMMALLEAVEQQHWAGTAPVAARTVLLAAGVPAESAREIVQAVADSVENDLGT